MAGVLIGMVLELGVDEKLIAELEKSNDVLIKKNQALTKELKAKTEPVEIVEWDIGEGEEVDFSQHW